jgi:hypothetical protein
MNPGNLRRSLLPLVTLVLALAPLFAPFAPHADASPNAWRFAWRPNWLPGDPWDDTSAPSTVLRSNAGVAAPGLLVAIDPKTGRIVAPTPEQRRAADEAARAAGLFGSGALGAPEAPLRVERIPGGGEVVHLDGRYQVYLVAKRDANGNIVTDCAPDLEAARRLLTQPPAKRAVREER